MQYQSSFYFKPGGVSDTTALPIRLDQGGFAQIDLMTRYELTRHLSVGINLRNVNNAKYLTALTFDQSRYSAPRPILGTISLRY
ncbi:hypothetical protein TomMM35A_04030 [Sphingobium sp. TomMM35A]